MTVVMMKSELRPELHSFLTTPNRGGMLGPYIFQVYTSILDPILKLPNALNGSHLLFVDGRHPKIFWTAPSFPLTPKM